MTDKPVFWLHFSLYLTLSPFILILNLNEKGSNLLPWFCFVRIEWFSLFLVVDVKKLRKSRVLTQKEALGMSSKKEKKPYEVPPARKASLKSLRECMASWAQAHRYALFLAVKSLKPEWAHDHAPQ